ncbi:PfkB family carbohydrate kinase [Streptomyces sp. NPDC006385]|uniref:PfkB family carbohydrate kinase n=1 Tax=Streptomyces sp. NPDC006385 TaxID=3156761 RepID=UPI0033ACA7DC
MTDTGPRDAPDVVDVFALGESMVTFLIASYGVDTDAVRVDPDRPTGIYFRTARDRATDAHEVAYYRAGSAASAMSVENVDLETVRAGRVPHLSGITAALSGGCLGLMRELVVRRPGRPLVSFDVNHRPGLWRDTDGPGVLLELARACDLVFVGADEAEAAWGVAGGSEAIRALLPEPRMLVVKQGARGATFFAHVPEGTPRAVPVPQRGGTPSASVPAPHVDVAAAVGAGDAFAAGFLSATLDDAGWERLRLGPGWTQAAERAEEEVPTP